MELDFGTVRRTVRQLKKCLKDLAGDPSAMQVHGLRTRCRRVEATVRMVTGGGKKLTHNLLKSLKPLRKAAGVVRDMDVLAENVRRLAVRDGSAAVLLAHLQERREQSARILMEAVEEQRKEVRASLDGFLVRIEKHSEEGHAKRGEGGTHSKAAKKLMDELSGWPAFDAENLHAFRVRVKELLYVLRLAGDAEARFVAALDKVKARIGDWHDWRELRGIAEEVLGGAKRCGALAEIEEIEAGKLKLALAAARRVKARFLGPLRAEAAGEP